MGTRCVSGGHWHCEGPCVWARGAYQVVTGIVKVRVYGHVVRIRWSLAL